MELWITYDEIAYALHYKTNLNCIYISLQNLTAKGYKQIAKRINELFLTELSCIELWVNSMLGKYSIEIFKNIISILINNKWQFQKGYWLCENCKKRGKV